MPRSYTRRFRVRSTDCDALGYVNHAVFARYLQETAIEASTDGGYGPARYVELGAGWVLRRSRIDYLRPLHYGEEIDVTTYVVNFRRVRSQRDFEIVHCGDGTLVTQAATDWVFVDRRTGAPTRIPDDALAAFLPDGPDPHAQLILDAPRLPDAAPPDAYHSMRRVNYYEMDEYQHVNNAVYLNYLEQAAIDAAASAGFDAPQLLELGGIFVVRQHDVEYLHPAKYGDTLDIGTWIGELTSGGVLRHTAMRDQDGELCLRAQTRWVWIDLASREAAPIPASLLDALATQTA